MKMSIAIANKAYLRLNFAVFNILATQYCRIHETQNLTLGKWTTQHKSVEALSLQLNIGNSGPMRKGMAGMTDLQSITNGVKGS